MDSYYKYQYEKLPTAGRGEMMHTFQFYGTCNDNEVQICSLQHQSGRVPGNMYIGESSLSQGSTLLF